MSRYLKPLLLPQLVEERKMRESMLDSEVYSTRNSSASDSPATPTFSTRHMRYSSSTSSIDTALYSLSIPIVPAIPSAMDSPSSGSFSGLKSSKRSLPDVQEEPQEREEPSMYDDTADLYDCFCTERPCAHHSDATSHSAIQLSLKPGVNWEYDLADGFFSDEDHYLKPKRHLSEESPLALMASRLGSRMLMPSFSRWRSRKSTKPATLTSEVEPDHTGSQGHSSRSSSISDGTRPAVDVAYDFQIPCTPARSIYDSHDDDSGVGIDAEMSDREIREREETLAATPLLPPLIMESRANKDVPVQSPLQSPSVADPSDSFSGEYTPVEGMPTPQSKNIPSPALSNKPSFSSLHRVNLSRHGHLVPSTDIPPIVIADKDDPWANKLGHANFTIYPEPYLPTTFDLEACRQLRADWDLARTNYTKHVVRTGEHYGATSRTYQLTSEKWAETEALWKKNNELTIQNTASSSDDAFQTLKHTALGDSRTSSPLVIPSLNDPHSGGKFPQLGDVEIVGPMVQIPAQLQYRPSRKQRFVRFFTNKFPGSFTR